MLGGLSGVWLALVPVDVHVSGTYFIVAHIHYVLFGGSVFTIYAGLYFWYPKMTGRMYNETLGKWHFWMTFITFNATFFPMHYIGTEGMLRRISDYEPKYANWNMFITLCAFGARRLDVHLRLQRDRLLDPRRARPGQPLALADARVAGLVAAAGLQLRLAAAHRRRPVQLRPARRPPRGVRRRPSVHPRGALRIE